MKAMKEEACEACERMVEAGLVTENTDGTYRATERGRAMIEELLLRNPDLYPVIFPDRVN